MSAPRGDHCPSGGPPPDGRPCYLVDCAWCVSRGYTGSPLDRDGTRAAWSAAFKSSRADGSTYWDAVGDADLAVPAVPRECARALAALRALGLT